MKLLYVPPLGGGIRDLFQAGQHRRLLEDYCQSWLKEFDEVLILSFFDESLADYPDIKIDSRVRLLANRGSLHRYVFSMMAPVIFRNELKDVSVVRVSQTTGALPTLAIEGIARILGRKLPVAMTYGYDYVQFATIRGQKALMMAKLHEWLGRVAHPHWITTTTDLQDHLVRDLGIQEGRITLVPNGVPLEKFQKRLSPAPDFHRLVFVGRLEAQKNLFELIEWLSRFADQAEKHFSLRLIGDGSLRSELKTHADEKCVSKRLVVEFSGNIEHSALPRALAEADLFVSNTLFEGHPKAVIEAMAIGLPILGRDSPGLGNLLKKSGQRSFSGFESFADGMRFYESSECRERAGKMARAYVEDNFSLESTLKLETSLLKKLALSEVTS